MQNETSYDEHWDKADRIYRLTTTLDRTGGNPPALPGMSFATLLLVVLITAGQTFRTPKTMPTESLRYE